MRLRRRETHAAGITNASWRSRVRGWPMENSLPACLAAVSRRWPASQRASERKNWRSSTVTAGPVRHRDLDLSLSLELLRRWLPFALLFPNGKPTECSIPTFHVQ